MNTFYVIQEVNAVADVDSVGGQVCWIRRINVPTRYRGKGYGSQLLDKICADADREGMILILYVVSSGELDDSMLKRWYERRNFIVQEDGYTLYRLPRTKQIQNFHQLPTNGCKSSEDHGILTCE